MQSIVQLPKTFSHWLHGLGAAFISGGATVVSSQAGLAMAQSAGIEAPLMNMKTMCIVFFSSGFFAAMNYLKQSPLPPENATTIVTDSVTTADNVKTEHQEIVIPKSETPKVP